MTAITIVIKAAIITAKKPLRSETLKLLMFPHRRETPPSQLYKILPQLSTVLGGAKHTEGSGLAGGRTPPHRYGEASSMWTETFKGCGCLELICVPVGKLMNPLAHRAALE